MLNVPTLWTVFVINFLALGLIWAYVVQSYPKFEAARFWTGSGFAAGAGAALAMLRLATRRGLLVPALAGGTGLVFSACLAIMGVQPVFDTAGQWPGPPPVTGVTCA